MDTDPPPELVIEIDITRPSLNKFPIFAGLGIPAVWRYPKQALTIFKLKDGCHRAQAASGLLPGVEGADLTLLIAESWQMKRPEWLCAVRELVRGLEVQP